MDNKRGKIDEFTLGGQCWGNKQSPKGSCGSVLFALFVTLFFVPALYGIGADIRRGANSYGHANANRISPQNSLDNRAAPDFRS